MQRGLRARFLALRSSGPVQKYRPPSCQTPSSGVTCGRPSGRTVDSQYTSASANSVRARDHSVCSAFGLLKELSSVTGSCSTNSSLLSPPNQATGEALHQGRPSPQREPLSISLRWVRGLSQVDG